MQFDGRWVLHSWLSITLSCRWIDWLILVDWRMHSLNRLLLLNNYGWLWIRLFELHHTTLRLWLRHNMRSNLIWTILFMSKNLSEKFDIMIPNALASWCMPCWCSIINRSILLCSSLYIITIAWSKNHFFLFVKFLILQVALLLDRVG